LAKQSILVEVNCGDNDRRNPETRLFSDDAKLKI